MILASGASPSSAQSGVVSPPRGDVRFVVLSDFNGPYGSLDYDARVDTIIRLTQTVWQPDALLSAGDVIAGQSTSLPEARFAEMWRVFDERVRASLAAVNIPVIVAMGNHDGSSQHLSDGSYSFARERRAARDYWQAVPTSLVYLNDDDLPFQTSLLVGDVFIAVWDASSATITEGQLAWLAAELARPEAQTASARILLGHLPLFAVSEAKNSPGEVLSQGQALATWLEQAGIDLYISGHHAAYYPAQWGDLKLLHSGGIGARQLIGSDSLPQSTVTILDVDTNPMRLREVTLNASNLVVINPQTLPTSITSLNGIITRW
ncbi:MAG: metallophosphoesterase [Deinococcota bacterium]